MTGLKMNCPCSCHAGTKPRFLVHLGVFIVVNTLLALINLATSPQHLWFQWPLFGWGIGLFFHGLGTLKQGASRRQEEERSGHVRSYPA